MVDNKKPTLLLIDGHSLAFRAFYALSPESFKTSDGQYTNAVHGFISMLLNILERERPSHIAVAFDLSRESFRNEELPSYKGTRGETPEEFLGQTELLTEVLKAMGILTLTRENYEADDVIASMVEQGESAGLDVLVVSGDRDTFQLISDQTTILYPVKGVLNLARMNDAAVLEKYGIHAHQYPDLAALVGETSDNLPGIPGVGPKTAAKWIQQYGSLQQILDHQDEIAGKVGESLREHRELAVRNRRLNRLVRELEFDHTIADLISRSVDEEQVREVFGKLEFKTLLNRLLRLRGTNGSQTAIEGQPEPVQTIATENLPQQREIVSAAKLVAKLGNEPAAVVLDISESLTSFASFGSSRLVWDGVESAELLDYLASNNPKIIWDSKDAHRKLVAIGHSLNGVVGDPLLEAYLLDPAARGYPMAELAIRELDHNPADADQLLSDTDPSETAWVVYKLHQIFVQSLEKQDQLRVLIDIELPTSVSLAKMESTGIAINHKELEELSSNLETEIAAISKTAFAIIGKEINLASPKQLQSVLFEDLGMSGTKAVKTGFSTNAEALNTLFEQTQHPFLESLLNYRELSKIRQITETMLQAIASDGRIHTTYVQTGTSTGRLSSENPNLQNIPIKSERGQQIRHAFIATAGFEGLLTADYSQIEMRIMAHLAGDKSLIDAFHAGEDLHNFVGARLFDVSPTDVNAEMRSKVKAMSYGLVYGLSEYGLAKQLRIDNSEAKQLMSDYFSRFGAVRDYLSTVVEKAKSLGHTTTEYGRRRPFPDLNSKMFQVRENARRAALNAPIQGTAADIMKIAMNRVSAEMQNQQLQSRMLLQVHDELVFEVYPGEREQLESLVLEQMSSAASLTVPLDVQIGSGSNWDEAGH